MIKRSKKITSSVDFKNVLPKIQIEKVKLNPLYEKAFLDRNEMSESEFNMNTTTWD